MKITYPVHSPYAETPQSTMFIGRYVHREIARDEKDIAVTLTAKHHLRPDILSNEQYGTPVYWWVFMQRNLNVIRDPIWDFTVGKTIMVPSRESLSRRGLG